MAVLEEALDNFIADVNEECTTNWADTFRELATLNASQRTVPNTVLVLSEIGFDKDELELVQKVKLLNKT